MECELYKHMKEYVDVRKISNKSVLGIDIYQYSSYGDFEQTLIPFLFKKMLHTTIELCLEHHPSFFKSTPAKLLRRILSAQAMAASSFSIIPCTLCSLPATLQWY
jgi:hypothetical protein